MKVDDIIREVKRLADDDQSIKTSDIQDWIDLGIDEINQNLKSNIPYISSLATSTIPKFDSRYHSILIKWCVAKYREGDSDYTAAQYFMKQFTDTLDMMQRDMPVPPSLRNDDSIIQLTATSDGQSIYNIPTLPLGSYYGSLKVYQNDSEITDYCTFNSRTKQMVIDTTSVTIKTNDTISIDFEINSELDNPPYTWWARSGW